MNETRQTHSTHDAHTPRQRAGGKAWLVFVLVLVVALLMGLAAASVYAALAGLYAPQLPGVSSYKAVTASILAGLLLLLMLCGVVYYAALTAVRRKIRAAQGWPAASGVVLTSEVGDDGGESGLYVRVVYRYEVGGRVYENSRLAVAVEYGVQNLPALERMAARFPVGAEVPVYYDPHNPADSALIKGDPKSWAPSRF